MAPMPTIGTTERETIQSFGEVMYSNSEPLRDEFRDRSPAADRSVKTSAASVTSNSVDGSQDKNMCIKN